MFSVSSHSPIVLFLPTDIVTEILGISHGGRWIIGALLIKEVARMVSDWYLEGGGGVEGWDFRTLGFSVDVKAPQPQQRGVAWRQYQKHQKNVYFPFRTLSSSDKLISVHYK